MRESTYGNWSVFTYVVNIVDNDLSLVIWYFLLWYWYILIKLKSYFSRLRWQPKVQFQTGAQPYAANSSKGYSFVHKVAYREVYHTYAVLAEWLARWRGNSVSKGHGFNPSCDQLFSLLRESAVWLSLARVDPALNGYLKKSGEGKQEAFFMGLD